MSIAYIGLGSNIGDRIGYIQQAHKLLDDTNGIKVLNASSLYETEPVGVVDQELFCQCERIEMQLGRIRKSQNLEWEPRTIDLDILLFGNEIIATNKLQIPHPRLHQRAFALVPLLELSPDVVHPVIGKTILEIHNELPDPEEVYLYGTRISDL